MRLLRTKRSRTDDGALDPEARLEQVRSSMLDALGAAGPLSLARRIRFAKDLPSLWFLRPDLLHVLARRESEAAARARVDQISVQFRGALPWAAAQR